MSAGEVLQEIKCSRFIGEIWLVLMQKVVGEIFKSTCGRRPLAYY